MIVEPGVPVSGLFLILHGVLLIETADDTSSWVTVGAPGQDVSVVLSQPHGGRSQAAIPGRFGPGGFRDHGAFEAKLDGLF